MTPPLATIPQGDAALLTTDLAQRLLRSNIYARLAYTSVDGTPRVLPIWFHWTGEELIFGTPLHSKKVKSLTRNPAVAVTIDTEEAPPSALLVRGRARITEHDDVFDDWYAAARRYLGDEAADEWRAGYRSLPFRWARIALRPEWVGLIDFQTRLPAAMAG
jgi:nitroimidazol reductase NimA-like FMN-containing flavoprotein (pyridoxamine 5'-phosphate oxidase superfamily)